VEKANKSIFEILFAKPSTILGRGISAYEFVVFYFGMGCGYSTGSIVKE
jgi:hypothetical protein